MNADTKRLLELLEWSDKRSGAEDVRTAKIVNVNMPTVITKGTKITIPVSVTDSSRLYYYFTNPDGKIVASDSIELESDQVDIILSEEQTDAFGIGANDLKLFTVSEEVLRPDVFTTSFLVVNYNSKEIPVVAINSEILSSEPDYNIVYLIVGIIAIGTITALVLKRRHSISVPS